MGAALILTKELLALSDDSKEEFATCVVSLKRAAGTVDLGNYEDILAKERDRLLERGSELFKSLSSDVQDVLLTDALNYLIGIQEIKDIKLISEADSEKVATRVIAVLSEQILRDSAAASLNWAMTNGRRALAEQTLHQAEKYRQEPASSS